MMDRHREERIISMKPQYKVFYNAVVIEKAAFVFAVGWTNSTGYQLSFEKNDNGIKFQAIPPESHAPILTPFHLAHELPGENMRSIFIEDDYGRHHIQLMGLTPCKPSENNPGRWVESGTKAFE